MCSSRVVELSYRSWVELGGAGNCCALDDAREAGSKSGHRKLAGNRRAAACECVGGK